MRNIKVILAMAAALAAAVSCGGSQAGQASSSAELRTIVSDASTTATTVYGRVQGYRDGDVYTFKGIPYAKAERFMPPQAPDPFDGVKVCRTYGPKTPQTSTSLAWRDDRSDYGFGFQFNLEPVDEAQCLVLNVWTKGLADGKKRPVFVWIHGGGFASGSGNDLPCYEGRALAEKGDIVVVNLNHRLNILGFLDLRGLGGKYAESVNLGMQDLVKALEWIRDNIEAFGGDPGCVTIAGQSGGGGKVNTLMAMPSAMGLFHRAIAQSGSWILHNSDADGKALGLQVVEELGLKPSQADKLADFTYEELAAAGHRATVKLQSSKGFCPTVDGKYVIDPSFDPEAPEISRNIPMLIGSNKNEFTYDNSPVLTQEEVMGRRGIPEGIRCRLSGPYAAGNGLHRPFPPQGGREDGQCQERPESGRRLYVLLHLETLRQQPRCLPRYGTPVRFQQYRPAARDDGRNGRRLPPFGPDELRLDFLHQDRQSECVRPPCLGAVYGRKREYDGLRQGVQSGPQPRPGPHGIRPAASVLE